MRTRRPPLASSPDGSASRLLLGVLWALLTLFIPLPARAQSASLDLELAREPAVVTTTTHREFSGLLDGFRNGRLYIRNATSGGEVGYSFAPAEIDTLELPGAELQAEARELWDRGAGSDALPLLEALGRQRLRYLPVLTDAQLAPLRLLVAASSRAGNPLATIGYVNQLRPYLASSDDRALLRDAELDAHVKLGDRRELRRLATAWCIEADPTGPSALGWEILAQLAYDAGDFATARWTALQPIVFSGYLPMEHLDSCYALAIAAADKLKDTAHATTLFREMQARQLAWPATPALAATGQHYAGLATQTAAATATVETPSAAPPSATPPMDQHRPLAEIRKLVRPAPQR